MASTSTIATPPPSPSQLGRDIFLSSSSPSVVCRGEIQWDNATLLVNQIGRFLASCDPVRVGTGFMLFDDKKFRLAPCSNWTNSHTIQWLLNLWNPNASYEGVMKGFTQLGAKIEAVKRGIELFNPEKPEDIPEQAKHFALELIDLQLIISGSAKRGLTQLCQNYESSWNKVKTPASLLALGEGYFETLKQLDTCLLQKITAQITDFQKNADLRRHHVEANKLISQWESYCAALRQTAWSSEGVLVSDQFVQDCISSLSPNLPKRMALQIASNAIKLPSLAQPIPAMRESVWIPVRPALDDERQICFQSGTFGTCERNGNEDESICNLYHLFHSDLRQLVVGCGAMNTRLKAQQMLALLREKLGECASKRVVIHQLNSWFNETPLIQDVHLQSFFLNEQLQTLFPEEGVHVVHLNTAFNAATRSPKEDPKSVREINVDAMAQLFRFVVTDLYNLMSQALENPDANVNLFYEEPAEILEVQESFEQAPNEQRSQKKAEEPFVFDLLAVLSAKCNEATEIAAHIQRVKRGLHEEVTEGLIDGDEDSRLTSSNSSPDLNMDSPSRLSEIPPLMGETAQELRQQQQKLSDILKDVAVHSLPQLIELWTEKSRSSPCAPLSKKAILMMTLLKDLFSLQLSISGAPKLSRCSEVESFLLLYRLLNINPIITCKSGLDRSGVVRALLEAQTEMERLFDERLLPSASDTPSLAKVQASERIYRMIREFDFHRNKIFELGEALLKEKKLSLVVDLRRWEEAQEQDQSVRQCILDGIDRGRIISSEAQLLKDTYAYSELFFKQLNGTEGLKPLYSTGVSGFKFHHDKNKFVANPHAIERMPFVVAVEGGKWIKIVDFSNWYFWGPSHTLTPAAVTMTHRLSRLRGS